MFKTLLKKQLLESFSWLFKEKKSNRKRSNGSLILVGVVYLLLFAFLGFFFFEMGKTLCEPLCKMGFGWLYVLLMSMIALIFGVIGCVFNTYSSLYNAKDNDMLLSMPIPPRLILISRLLGVYLTGFIYQLIITLPTIIVWFIYGTYSFLGAIFTLLIPFILSFIILSLSCLLGFVVAFISTKIKNKSFITVIISIAFILVYFVLYSKMYDAIESLIQNASDVANSVKGALFPFYHLGLGAEGNVLSMLISTGIFLAITLLICYLMSISFIKFATTNKGNKKSIYIKRELKTSGIDGALLKKEFKRFLSSPTYLLNCGLGLLFMPIIAVLLIVFNDYVILFAELFGSADLVLLILTSTILMTLSMCYISAPSISLEGKNIWILRMFPIKAWQVLKAKLKLHVFIALIPALFLAIVSVIVTKAGALISILSVLMVIVFILFHAEFGLFINLKHPNFNWKNETVPIKQGLSVTLALFGGWIIIFAFIGLYFAVKSFLSPSIYLLILFVILTGLTATLYYLLKTKGEKVFSNL